MNLQKTLVLAAVLGFYQNSVVDAACPKKEDDPLSIIFIGNSYTGGTSVGRACAVQGPGRRASEYCREMAVPGSVKDYYNRAEPYLGKYDHPPDQDTLVDPSSPYNPLTNNHRGDVPSKIMALANTICQDSSSIQYVQNSQSKFTTRVHAGEASPNPQFGTLHLLDTTPHDIVVVQPQSTEYMKGALDSRVSALQNLFRSRSNANANTRYVLQHTWPRRESTIYNHICTSTEDGEKKHGMLEEVTNTIRKLGEHLKKDSITFEVSPAGRAFVEFGKLACGTDILSTDGCSFDENVYCPVWFGQHGKISLYEEAAGTDGTHQSEEIGAWLSASVLYGVLQSKHVCYISEEHLEEVMPTIPYTSLAHVPSGLSIPYIIAESAKIALKDMYGPSIPQCSEYEVPRDKML